MALKHSPGRKSSFHLRCVCAGMSCVGGYKRNASQRLSCLVQTYCPLSSSEGFPDNFHRPMASSVMTVAWLEEACPRPACLEMLLFLFIH